MKLRNCFVSNSSTCSFCIYGAEATITDVKDILTKSGVSQDDLDNLGMEELAPEGLTIQAVWDWGMAYIGRDFTSIGDEETGSQFKRDVENRVQMFFGEKKDCSIQEGEFAC